jgi:hypothetical protein
MCVDRTKSCIFVGKTGKTHVRFVSFGGRYDDEFRALAVALFLAPLGC